MLIICMITIIQIFNLSSSIDKLKEKDKEKEIVDEDGNIIENYNITYNKPFHHHHHHPFHPLPPPPSQRDFIRNFDWQSKFNPFIKQFDRPENHQIGDLNVRKYFDIPTRGPPNDFHIIGTLSRIDTPPPPTNEENKDENNDGIKGGKLNSFIDDNRVLNLYGRAKYPNGYSTFEYYTRITSGNEMIKIDLGERKEMLDGDTIHIDELNADYKLKTYPNDMFRYDPFDFRDY